MGLTPTIPVTPQVFQVAQHKNLDLVNTQLKARKTYLTAATQPTPGETGKTNPFE
jgi:ATP-dependent DNA ligase